LWFIKEKGEEFLMNYEGLSTRKKKFVDLLLDNDNNNKDKKDEDKAKDIGINVETYRKWKHDSKLLKIAYNELIKRLPGKLIKSIKELEKLARGKDVQAMKYFIDFAVKNMEKIEGEDKAITTEVIKMINEIERKPKKEQKKGKKKK